VSAQDATHAEPSVPRTYVLVFLALLGLLAATVGAAFVDFGRWLPMSSTGLAIALSIAVAKGLLIVLFFMHARSGPRRNAVFASAGFVWLAILISLAMADYLTRNHPPGDSPKGEPRFIQPR
jgi:cytochrome c oxidase subunit 4